MAVLSKNGVERLWLHIVSRLNGKANVHHTHAKSDITDLQDLMVTDDGNGNVVMTYSYSVNADVYNLQSRMTAVENTLNENGYLVVSDE